MGRFIKSKSNDSAANNAHPRTVASINLVGSTNLNSAKSSEAKSHEEKSRVAKSGVIKSGVIKSRVVKFGVAKSRVAKSSESKSSVAKSHVAKSSVVKPRISKPRFTSSAKKAQRIKLHSITQKTEQIKLPNIISEDHQGKFVDARRLPGLDFVKKTLSQTSGSLGMMTRPHIINFRERFKERKNAIIRFTLKRIIATLVVVAAVAATVWLLLFSPVFRLQANDIDISGSNEWVSEQTIASIASTQVNKSLFLVSSQEVIGQLNDIPGVTKAKVTKKFPHSLQITVRAQRPAAMLKTRDGNRMTAVDAKGRVLNAVAQVSIKGIPVIEVTDMRRSLNSRAVLEAVKIVSSLPESLRMRVTKVSAKTQDSVETELGDVRRTIVWGDSSQLELKKAIVAKIIDDPSKIGNRSRLDVSSPVRPILK